jgi:DNA-binding transcriptional ArsR family regulator
MASNGDSIESNERCAAYLKALADPVRLQIVKALRASPMAVSDLAMFLDLEMANVSHHLRVLYHAKIVTTQREGKFIYYTLNKDFLRSKSVSSTLDFGCCKFDLRD